MSLNISIAAVSYSVSDFSNKVIEGAVVTPRTQVSTVVELSVGAFALDQKVHAEAAKSASAAPLDCWMQGAPARIASMAGAALVMLNA